jgi:hypothetical protein
MSKPTNQETKDFNRKAAFIEKHGTLYLTDPIWRQMVDNTVYLTDDQIHESMAAVGGSLRKGHCNN